MSDPRSISFENLKKAITPDVTRRILQYFQLLDRFTAEADGSLRGSCPFQCEKASGRSFKITADGRAWFNHDRACHCLPVNEETGQPVRGGNMLDFIRFKTGGTIRDAGLLLDTLLRPPKAGEAQAKPAKTTPSSSFPSAIAQTGDRNPTFQERGLKPIDLDPDHEAIVSLGLEPETVKALGAGVSTKGLMRGRLAFPLHDVKGELIAYAGFKLDKASEGPLWLLPKDFNPGLELIGFSALVGRFEDMAAVVLTFDMLEAAFASQAFGNSHHVLTILSTELSAEQHRLLTSLVTDHGFTGAFLVLDTPPEKSGGDPSPIDRVVLRLARIAPTKCVILA